MTIEIPDIIIERGDSIISKNDRAAMRRLVETNEFQSLLVAIEALRPSVYCERTGAGERDQFSNERAAIRLAEMRGWDLHRGAIYAILNPPKQKAQTPVNYQPVEESISK